MDSIFHRVSIRKYKEQKVEQEDRYDVNRVHYVG